MPRWTIGICSEKCVVRQFHCCANFIECTYTNLGSTVWILGYKPVQYVTVPNTVGNCNTMVSTVILCYNIIILRTTVVYAARRWRKLRYTAHACTITGKRVPCNSVTFRLQSAPWRSLCCIMESICLYLVTYYVDKLQNINVSEEPTTSIIRADVRHRTFVRKVGNPVPKYTESHSRKQQSSLSLR